MPESSITMMDANPLFYLKNDLSVICNKSGLAQAVTTIVISAKDICEKTVCRFNESNLSAQQKMP